MQKLTCCMLYVWSVEFFEHSGIRKPWYLCFLSRILSSQFIFILVQFLGSRQSVSLPCLCVAGWWVALGSLACWLCPGMWSTGKTTPPFYWYSCVTTAVFNKQSYLSFENLKLPFFFFFFKGPFPVHLFYFPLPNSLNTTFKLVILYTTESLVSSCLK